MSVEMIRLSIILRLALVFVRVMCITGIPIPGFNYIFVLLWTVRGSSVGSVAFLLLRELK
jgi:hypothetical protein